ncbi:SMI1/KNR4 family protein [Nocardia heshunensis]
MEWKPWLSRWSEEWIRGSEPGTVEPEVVRGRWLGFAPASESEVAAAEARIGRTLPPSYREFLLTTNGWRNAGYSVRRMRDTSNLGWLRDLESNWESWEELSSDPNPQPENGNRFTRGLLISLDVDLGVLFLDPGDVDAAGEWAAYDLGAWNESGPTRYPSFSALMEDLYAETHRMLQPTGDTRDQWDVQVEQARRDALAGDTNSATALLVEAEKFGRERATLLRVQLQLFLERESSLTNQSLSRVLRMDAVSEGFLTTPLFTEELLPYLFVQHARDSRPYLATVLQGAMIEQAPVIQLAIGEYQARLRYSGPALDFGDPGFDALIRQALAAHPSDSEALWQAVRTAMRHWVPRSPDHIAPVVLLAHPVLAEMFTPERGRELLSLPRGER